jgi:hypothetical protein
MALFTQNLTLYSDELWLTLNGYVNNHNNRYWNTYTPYCAHEVLLYDLKIEIWFAVNA